MTPYIILAVVLAIGSAGIGGYFKGGKDARNEAIAEQAKVVDAAIQEHNETAAIDMQAAFQRGQAEAKVRVITRTIQGEVNVISASAPIPANCRLDPERRKLLDKAIAAANGSEVK